MIQLLSLLVLRCQPQHCLVILIIIVLTARQGEREREDAASISDDPDASDGGSDASEVGSVEDAPVHRASELEPPPAKRSSSERTRRLATQRTSSCLPPPKKRGTPPAPPASGRITFQLAAK